MLVKICGVQSMDIARVIEESGADAMGFMFVKASRRFIEVPKAAEISREVRGIRKIGVFVDAPITEVREIAKRCRLDMVQLHGHESSGYAEELKLPILKAYRWGEDFSAEAANAYPAEYILLDTYDKGQAGGTGKCFDWERAAADMRKLKKPCFAAGGLNAENVGEAIRILQPAGVDVSGGVEENGRKSADKIREFMEQVRRTGGRNG